MGAPDAGGDAGLRGAAVRPCGGGGVPDGKSAAHPADGGRVRVHCLRRDDPVPEAAMVFPGGVGRSVSAGYDFQAAGAGGLSPVLESDAQYLYRRNGLGASQVGDAASCGEKRAVPDAVCRGGGQRRRADLLPAEQPCTGRAGRGAACRRFGGDDGFQDKSGASRIGRVGGGCADSHLQRMAEPESGVSGHSRLGSLRNRGGTAAVRCVGSRRARLDAEDRRKQPQGDSCLPL